MRAILAIFLLLVSLASPACAATPTSTASPAAVTPPADPELARAEELFAARGDDAKKLEEAAALFEKRQAWARAARACCERFQLHEDLDDAAKEKWIDRGIADACNALGAEDLDAALEALPSYGKDRAETVYWLAALYGPKIELSFFVKRAFMVKTLRRLIDRACELDASALRHAPARMRATFLLSAPGAMGGDEEKGKRELDAAIAAEPDMLEGYYLRAEKVHGPAKDRAAWKADLARVEAGKDDAVPGWAPEQRGTKKDARKLLAKEGELFD